MHPTLLEARALIDRTCVAIGPERLAAAYGDRWTGAEVVEHLAKAFAATAYILDKCAADGRPVATGQSAVQRLFTVLIVRVGYFPPGRRAPAMTIPEGLRPEEALAAARTALDALDRAAATCLEAFGPRTRVANHPLLGGFTVDEWRRFHRAHTRHHMRLLARRR